LEAVIAASKFLHVFRETSLNPPGAEPRRHNR